MGNDPSPQNLICYESSARRDLRFWALLLVGAVFLWAGLTIDPATNCSESGECAPILVPLAAVMGLLALVAGAGRLLANPSRGSRLDLEAGTLAWWQDRTRKNPGYSNSIALADIAIIRIRKDSDSADGIHLFDHAGERQAHFDAEVLPLDAEKWARRLVAARPHIRLEVV